MKYAIETKNLYKTYNKKTQIIKDLNLKVSVGEIHGFLGRNGAGKTTTLKLLLGITRSTSGEILINGNSLKSKKICFQMGSVIEYPAFYPNLTPIENLDIHRIIMGIPNKDYIYEVLDIVGLSMLTSSSKKVKQLSLGMRQRLGIARALIHKPSILILDEPTNGLDPLGIKELRETLKNLCKNEGITILLSSHIITEISELADTITIIEDGRIIDVLDNHEIKKLSDDHIKLKCDDISFASVILEKNLNIQKYSITGKNEILIYDTNKTSAEINKLLINNNVAVSDIYNVKESLEDYFVRVIGGVKCV